VISFTIAWVLLNDVGQAARPPSPAANSLAVAAKRPQPSEFGDEADWRAESPVRAAFQLLARAQSLAVCKKNEALPQQGS